VDRLGELGLAPESSEIGPERSGTGLESLARLGELGLALDSSGIGMERSWIVPRELGDRHGELGDRPG
jgi:hypothetical protein